MRRGWTGVSRFMVLAAGACAGCSGPHNVLDPAGPQAGSVGGLWWMFFGVTTGVYLVVMAAGAAAIAKRRRDPPHLEDGGDVGAGVAALGIPDVRPDMAKERIAQGVTAAALALSAALLFILLIGDFTTGRALHGAEGAQGAMDITVTGHQWWWDVQYESRDPSQILRTSNEVHIPVGKPVRFTLRSTDVIHSFWLPNLQGKKDLIPGYVSTLMFQADKPGTYMGQCAEYCGFQHAHMRLTLVAQPREEFDAWLAAQRQPAPNPGTEAATRGREVFLSTTCAMCHTVAGTMAGSRVGPDPTHVASRSLIGAGALANTPANLRRWVEHPQSVKPGVRMPDHALPSQDMDALMEYLGTLR